MKKVGILTFHYSNNYGAILQALSLYRTLKSLDYDVEIINFVPSTYKPDKIMTNLGLRNKILKNRLKNLDVVNLIKQINLKNKYCRSITSKFNIYRVKNMTFSEQVDENSLETILVNYSAIIVGSDQVWNPSERKRHIYFLNFGDKYKGKKISYAADSTVEDVNSEDIKILRSSLSEFHHISVRNKHSFDFVKKITNKEAEVVADPTLLFDLDNVEEIQDRKEDYILTYFLGKDIEGSHLQAIKLIKSKYGNLPVYSIKIPTMAFELPNFADKVFYDLDPNEWLGMFKKAKFVYTDSFHGVLFSLKHHKPFLAYYTEQLRASRFIDLANRYGINKYIVQNVCEIQKKKSLESLPDFDSIDNIIEHQKKTSLEYLKKSLRYS